MNYAPFDEIRPKLEKQYENAVFSAENIKCASVKLS